MGFAGSSSDKESTCNAGDPSSIPGLVRSGKGIGYPFWYSWASLVAQMVKNPPAVGFNPWVGKIPWSRKWQPLQCSCLKNHMDRGAWWAIVHAASKSQM